MIYFLKHSAHVVAIFIMYSIRKTVQEILPTLGKQINSRKLDGIFCVYMEGNLKGCSVIRVITLSASMYKKYYEDKLLGAELFKYPS